MRERENCCMTILAATVEFVHTFGMFSYGSGSQLAILCTLQGKLLLLFKFNSQLSFSATVSFHRDALKPQAAGKTHIRLFCSAPIVQYNRQTSNHQYCISISAALLQCLVAENSKIRVSVYNGVTSSTTGDIMNYIAGRNFYARPRDRRDTEGTSRSIVVNKTAKGQIPLRQPTSSRAGSPAGL